MPKKQDEAIPVEDYTVVGAEMTVGELIDLLSDSPPEAGVFIGIPNGIDGLADDREPVTKVFTITFHGRPGEPKERIGYVSIYGRIEEGE